MGGVSWLLCLLWQDLLDWLREPSGGMVGQSEQGMFPVRLQMPDGSTVPAIQFRPSEQEYADRANREGRLVLVPPCYLVLPEYAHRLAPQAKADAPTFPMQQAKGVQ